jgi:aspartokinase/homoserine dehydrogenase 1
MEIDEIENESFMPAACLETTTNEAFFESLQDMQSTLNLFTKKH